MSEVGFKKAMKLIAGSEGGYSNHHADNGGPTMKGVTLRNYQAYCKRKGKPKPGIAQLKLITDAEVEEIFRTDYWNRVRGDALPAGLDYAAADFAFNSGSGQAVKDLQRSLIAIGAQPGAADGKMGSKTLSAINDAFQSWGEDKVINAYMDRRLTFMKGLSDWGTFKKGWTNRIRDVRANALNIAHGDPTYQPVANEGAKANPANTKTTAISGGKSTITTIGGAVATGATAAAGKILEQTSYSSPDIVPWLIGGFIIVTIIASVITIVILRRKPAEEGTV